MGKAKTTGRTRPTKAKPSVPKREPTAQTGMIVVLSGASGSGKTTLASRLMELVPRLEKSISFTTRPPRSNEIPDVSYHFVDEKTFRAMEKRNAFIVWAEYSGHLYGTSAEEISRRIDAGIDVVCDIDVQGGAAIRGRFEDDSVHIFVLPPSWAELERRLRGRGTDSDAMIERRLERAREEHRRASTYDYLVVNDDFSNASGLVADIVRAERQRTRRVKAALSADLLDPHTS